MSPAQEELYEETKSYYRNEILKMIAEQGIGKSHIYLLQGLNKLRQIANHPKMVDELYEGDAGKFSDVIHTLENIMTKGHKVLVFSQFVKHLKIFKEYFEQQNIDFAYLDGSTTNREEVVNHFKQDEEKQVFLISIKAGGVGLNLTAADYVYIVDPWWNPAVEQQAIDRTHRIGQTKNIFAYRMICNDTVEDKILKLQDRKRSLAKELISDEDGFIKSLTKDDINYLFS